MCLKEGVGVKERARRGAQGGCLGGVFPVSLPSMGRTRAVARACQGCRWHFCHGCDWHLPYCSTHCTFSVAYGAPNEGRNRERGRNGETGGNGGGSRTALRHPSPTQVMGLRALAVPKEPRQKGRFGHLSEKGGEAGNGRGGVLEF